MQLLLEIASGPSAGRKVLLRSDQTVRVGRTNEAEFCVSQDAYLSSVHFSLRCDADACRLEDLESTHGTFVNGERVLAAALNDGDTISAGKTAFKVRIVRGATAPTLPRATPASPSPPLRKETLPGSFAPGSGAGRTATANIPPLSPVLLAAAASGLPFDKALIDDDPSVRREALLAAVWTRQRWLLEYCRSLASKPLPANWDALWLLAVLGQPGDLDAVRQICRGAQLGSQRWQLYASYGHPRLVGDLLVVIAGKDVRDALAAGAAYTKITGAEIASQKRVQLDPEEGHEPDGFEREFLDEAFLPSPELAMQHWQSVKDRFAQGVRWRQGLDVSRGPTLQQLAQLDREGIWEARLRGQYEGTWRGSPQQFEAFPSPFPP
jgi:hypothetical protein